MRTDNPKEITKNSYQTTATDYARQVANLAPTSSIERFSDLLGLNATIIDLGCGSGRDAKLFTDLGLEVVGVDFCQQLIDIAKMHAPKAQFHLMDIEALDFETASFDGAWAACSLAHIAKADLPKTLNTIHSILKDNGYLYLAVKQGNGEVLEKDCRYEGNPEKFWAYYEEQELRQTLEQAQFQVMDMTVIGKQFDYQTHPALRAFCQKK